MKAIKLEDQELKEVLKQFPANKKSGIRLFKYLAKNPDSVTVDVNREAVIGNISNIARAANTTIYPSGLLISCKPPKEPIHNSLGELSGMYLWGVYRLEDQEAANDDTF